MKTQRFKWRNQILFMLLFTLFMILKNIMSWSLKLSEYIFHMIALQILLENFGVRSKLSYTYWLIAIHTFGLLRSHVPEITFILIVLKNFVLQLNSFLNFCLFFRHRSSYWQKPVIFRKITDIKISFSLCTARRIYIIKRILQ